MNQPADDKRPWERTETDYLEMLDAGHEEPFGEYENVSAIHRLLKKGLIETVPGQQSVVTTLMTLIYVQITDAGRAALKSKMPITEKVARAICAKEEPDGLGDWKDYVDHARAAIEAMREPTDGMKVSGGLKCEAIMFENDPDGTGVIFNDMGHVYRAMIDAALKEGK